MRLRKAEFLEAQKGRVRGCSLTKLPENINGCGDTGLGGGSHPFLGREGETSFTTQGKTANHALLDEDREEVLGSLGGNYTCGSFPIVRLWCKLLCFHISEIVSRDQ